jgi:phosphatidylserine decarboxylase
MSHVEPERPPSFGERFAVLPQYLYPKQAMTAFAGFVAGNRWGATTTWIIRRFVDYYSVDMNEAVEPDITRYASFNDFFTRALKPAARPLAASDLVCPVDGAVSQFGRIEGRQIFQAKGHHYSADTLLGGDPALAAQFTDGHFATLYLSPKDYHRVHMPCDGQLVRMTHVPGELFSVNPTTARGVPGLFARNERVVCLFESKRGPFVLVLVGATIVGSMSTVWHGVINPPRVREARTWHYADRTVQLARGEEMGRFQLGSTVVMLFPQGPLAFNPAWQPNRSVMMGEAMGEFDRS